MNIKGYVTARAKSNNLCKKLSTSPWFISDGHELGNKVFFILLAEGLLDLDHFSII